MVDPLSPEDEVYARLGGRRNPRLPPPPWPEADLRRYERTIELYDGLMRAGFPMEYAQPFPWDAAMLRVYQRMLDDDGRHPAARQLRQRTLSERYARGSAYRRAFMRAVEDRTRRRFFPRDEPRQPGLLQRREERLQRRQRERQAEMNLPPLPGPEQNLWA